MVSNLTGSKPLWADLPSSMSAWQLPRQFAIVLRFGRKERALVERLSGCLIEHLNGFSSEPFLAAQRTRCHALCDN